MRSALGTLLPHDASVNVSSAYPHRVPRHVQSSVLLVNVSATGSRASRSSSYRENRPVVVRVVAAVPWHADDHVRASSAFFRSIARRSANAFPPRSRFREPHQSASFPRIDAPCCYRHKAMIGIYTLRQLSRHAQLHFDKTLERVCVSAHFDGSHKSIVNRS